MRNLLLALLVIFNTSKAYNQNPNQVAIKKITACGIKLNFNPGAYSNPIEVIIDNPNQLKLEYRTGWNPSDEFSPWKNNLYITENTFLELRVTKSNGEVICFQGNYLVGRSHTLPIICLRVIPDEFFPPNGIYVGSVIKTEVENNIEGKIEVSGKAFDKIPIKCFAEFIYQNKSVEATSCLLKTFGGMTLGMPEKSLHLIADTSIGKKSFDYPFFVNKPYNQFEHLVLRTSGNDQSATRFKDMCLSSLVADAGVDYMDYQPCSFYVNDKYFGIINLREKINYDYLKYNHHAIKDSSTIGTASASQNQEYQSFMKWIGSYSDQNHFKEEVKKRIDLEEYMNFIIFQTFICNADSRGNIRFWKASNLENKWRWIFYDSDLACDSKARNFLSAKISSEETEWYNPKWSTLIFRKIATSKSTQDLVINQMCLLQSTKFHPDTIQNRINYFTKWIEPEIPYHINRFPHKSSEKSWRSHIENMKLFFEKRKATFHHEMCETFNLNPERVQIVINSNYSKLPLLTANESKMRFNYLDGLFYKGRMLNIEAVNRFPYFFSGWKNQDSIKSPKHNIDLNQSQTWTAIFKKAEWNQKLKPFVGIRKWGTQMNKKEELHWVEMANLSGGDLNLEEWKFHFFENETSFQLPSIKWADNNSIIITNNKTKWQNQFPDFTGIIIELPICSQFRQNGTLMLSIKDEICDSLHYEIPDSLMTQNKWLVISTKEGIQYKKWKENEWNLDNFRDKPFFIAADIKNNDFSTFLVVGIFLIGIGFIYYALVKRKKTKEN